MARVLAGLRRYQEAQRAPPRPPAPAVAEILGATLRDYGGKGPPVLFVPSLINPPNVLDLGEEKSLLRWLAGQGFRVLLVDWGWDVAARRHLSVAGHVEKILLPFIAALPERPALVGYCLGGTMAAAAAALAKAPALATIATPWRFSAFDDQERHKLVRLWRSSEAAADALGALPMEVLQSAFWSLDPARTVAKFERFAGLTPSSPETCAFVTLEDWANDGPPMPLAAARQMFGFFESDDPGRGAWRVGGRTIRPGTLPSPILNIVSTTDRIVPAATAMAAGDRLELARGHVGMVVGGGAKEALWEPLAAWLSRTLSS